MPKKLNRMKKITLALFALLLSTGFSFGQANILVKAPPGNNATTQVRAPNGNASHTTMRGCFLVTQAELTPYMLPGTNISSFGFTLTSGVTGSPVTGNFTVYLQNTNDATYLKGTSFAAAIAPMSNNYTGNMTIPVSATSTSISLTLTTPFTYTGGGIYVAYDWISTGPFSSTVATYMADNSLGVGGASNSTTIAPAVDAISTTAFRPVYLFGAPNTATNDVQVVAVEAPGSIAGVINTPHNIKAIIKNGSNTALSNVPVTLNVTGANPFTDTQTITTIASGAQTTVTFSAFNPQLAGVNSISVSVPTDQLPLNNSGTYSQSVSCNYMGQSPQPATYTAGVGFSTGNGIIGARMIPPVTSTCTGIRIGISSDAASVGKSIWGVLLNSSGTILATTNTIAITAPMQGSPQNFTFAAPQNLTSGTTYYLGMAQPAGTPAYFPLGSTTSGYIPTGLYVTTFTTGGAPSALTQNLGYFAIDAILAYTPPVITISPSSPTVCSGTSVSLTASGAATYTWNTSSTGSLVVVTPTAASVNYSLAGASSPGCPATSSITINTAVTPTVTSSATNTLICPGGSSSLSATGADTYSWSTGGLTQGISVSPASTSIYTVVGTATASGCYAISTVTVAVDIPSVSISGPSAICNGSSVTLTANGANTYSWSTGSSSTSVVVSPTVNTAYVLTGTTAAGCPGSQTLNITVNNPPSLTITALPGTTVCAGSQFTLSFVGANNYSIVAFNGTMNLSGSSQTIANGVIYSPTVTSIYTVTGTYSTTNTCPSTKTINVVVSTCTGVDELQPVGAQISVYPNPSAGFFNVEITGNNANTEIVVYNLLGVCVKKQKVKENHNRIDLTEEANGIYLVKIVEDNKVTKTIKLIKQ